MERDKEGDKVRPAADYSVIRMKDVGKKDFKRISKSIGSVKNDVKAEHIFVIIPINFGENNHVG